MRNHRYLNRVRTKFCIAIVIFILAGISGCVSATSVINPLNISDALVLNQYNVKVMDNGIEIEIGLENRIPFGLNVTGTIYPPPDFLSIFKMNKTFEWRDPKNESQVFDVQQRFAVPFNDSITINWGEIEKKSVVTNLETFNIPINDTLALPDIILLNLTYGLLDDEYEITRTFEISTESDHSNQESRIMSPDPLQIVSCSISDSSLYKGQALHFTFGVRNNYFESLYIYMNTQIKELTNLYHGFSDGVWAYPDVGENPGVWIYPGQTIYFTMDIGPFLHDANRGYWVLNGAQSIDNVPSQAPSRVAVSYQAIQVRAFGWNGWELGFYSPSITGPTFTVTQNPNEHEILVAVVDDQWTGYSPTVMLDNAVSHTFKIGSGNNLGSATNLCDEFDLDFHFLHVGTITWDSRLAGSMSSGIALDATMHQLGESLKLGGAWVGAEQVTNPHNSNYKMGFTMRENHGFDLGIGLMSGGFISLNGKGMAYQLGSVCAIIGTYDNIFSNPSRQEEVAVHEILHLFGGIHGDTSNPEFGDHQGGDGYTYIMAGGTGYDIDWWSTDWRMHYTTRDRVNSYYRTTKFDGVPIPEQVGGTWYGQTECYVSVTQPTWSPLYWHDNSGKYYWSYNSQHYDRYSISNDKRSVGNDYIIAQDVDGEIDYYASGKCTFLSAYKFYWDSSYWPSGFNPITDNVYLKLNAWLWQSSSRYISSVDNVRLYVFDTQTANPTQYYFDWWKASSPGVDWQRCDKQWGFGKRDILVNDVSTWIAYGFRDAWTADYSQHLYIDFGVATYHFWYTDW